MESFYLGWPATFDCKNGRNKPSVTNPRTALVFNLKSLVHTDESQHTVNIDTFSDIIIEGPWGARDSEMYKSFRWYILDPTTCMKDD